MYTNSQHHTTILVRARVGGCSLNIQDLDFEIMSWCSGPEPSISKPTLPRARRLRAAARGSPCAPAPRGTALPVAGRNCSSGKGKRHAARAAWRRAQGALGAGLIPRADHPLVGAGTWVLVLAPAGAGLPCPSRAFADRGARAACAQCWRAGRGLRLGCSLGCAARGRDAKLCAVCVGRLGGDRPPVFICAIFRIAPTPGVHWGRADYYRPALGVHLGW